MEKTPLDLEPAHVHTLISRYMLADGFDLVADLEKSRGAYLYDSKRGEYFLDFFACFATLPVGYNHPKLTSREAMEELGRAAVQKPSNSDIYSSQMAEFVETFARLGVPDFMKHIFFIEGGALAVENGLKAAFDWKVRRNLAAGKGERGSKVIHFREAFHGRSGYTLSLTNTDPVKTRYFPQFKWPRIINPKCTFPMEGENLEKVKNLEAEALAQIQSVLEREEDDIACLILEPLQSEGGDHHFRPQFHRRLRKICDQHEILFIYDEVQTGFGATGRMWAFEHYVKPDIVCFGKKSQVCGILVSGRIDEVPDNVFDVSSRINSTWGGNLVDMVRSRMHLEIYEEEGLLEHCRRMGECLLQHLRRLELEFPDKVSNARGLGLLCAFDLPDTDFRDRLRQRLFQRRLIILPCGTRSIRFRSSLNIPEEDLLKGLRIIRDTLAEM